MRLSCASENIFQNQLLAFVIVATWVVRTDGIDNAARFATLAALVKRGLSGLLKGIALDQRPRPA
jgi:predicted phage tail protein